MQKLIRDRIPELMVAAGLVPSISVLRADERMSWLLAKLHEEAAELARTPNLEECADVFEVLTTIAHELGYSVEMLIQAASEKRGAKGGFSKGLIIHVEEPTT